MPTKKHRPGQQPRRRPQGKRRGAQHQDDELGLLPQIDEALNAGHPLGLLQLVSAMLNSVDARNQYPLARSLEPELPPLAEILDALVDMCTPQTDALAWTLCHLSEDEMARARVVRQVGTRAGQLPGWIRDLSSVRVVGAQLLTDPLRDGCDVVFGVHLGGYDFTAVAYVDFNLGTVVTDGFCTDQTLEEFDALWAEHAEVPHGTIENVSLAAARAKLTEAIEAGAMTWPPPESDSWPHARPLFEWLARQLPEGGEGWVRPSWSESELQGLADVFFASPAGHVLDDPDGRSILRDLLWYRTDYGYGDPVRWSPLAVEILLLAWYPRKIMADAAYFERMPAVLRGWVPYAHKLAGIPAELTAQTLGAVEQHVAEYVSTVRPSGRRRRKPSAKPGGSDLGLITEADLHEGVLQLAADEVGGSDELNRLDAEPLPDEPFCWDDIPNDVAPHLAEVLRWCDECCDTLFDFEFRTAVRRLLHDVTVAEPAIFRRRAKPESSAAGLCWQVGRANEAVAYPGTVASRELLNFFGMTSMPTSRVNTMRTALGLPQDSPTSLGSSRYLTSGYRHRLVSLRDAAALGGDSRP